jgi:hypothetical protein
MNFKSNLTPYSPIQSKRLPLWLSAFGIVAALLQLALFAPALGVAAPVPVAMAVTVFVLWLIAFAGQLLFSKNG